MQRGRQGVRGQRALGCGCVWRKRSVRHSWRQTKRDLQQGSAQGMGVRDKHRAAWPRAGAGALLSWLPPALSTGAAAAAAAPPGRGADGWGLGFPPPSQGRCRGVHRLAAVAHRGHVLRGRAWPGRQGSGAWWDPEVVPAQEHPSVAMTGAWELPPTHPGVPVFPWDGAGPPQGGSSGAHSHLR